MKDAVYSGPDLEQALAAASRGLGVPQSELRYVQLDSTDAGSVRVAVLLDAMRPAPAAAADPPPRSTAPLEPSERIRVWFEQIAAVIGSALVPRIEETPDRLRILIETDEAPFFETDDDELPRALEHLMQRAFGAAAEPRRVTLELPGRRERREERLRAEALELARAVRADGAERSTGPLNSYERRLVHLAIAEAGGLETFSTGEGSDRSVTIRLASSARD